MVIYKCDLCKKECEKEDMTTIQLPINKYMYAMKNGIKLAKFKSGVEVSNIEICPTCAVSIANFLDSLNISS